MNTTRRNFLRASGAMLALPWLDSLSGFAHAADSQTSPQRLLMICLPLGIYRDAIIPKESGRQYQTPEYLSLLGDFRDRITIISGLDHPGVHGGHSAEPRIFTGVPSNKKNTRSLDQYLASKVGQETRYDSLVLSAGRNEFSWNDSGTMVPSESKMSRVYAKLFGQEDKASTDKVLREIGHGKSIMDLVQRQAKALRPSLSPTDQDKLEEYFESVRETERRLVKSERWVHTPKPKVDLPMPEDPADRAEIITQLRNVCDITHLAFQTDSTRVITFGYFQQNKVNVPGVSNAYHALSHHGKDPNNIAQLKRIEAEFFKELRRLLTNLKNTKEGDATLLDRATIVVLIICRLNHRPHFALLPTTVPLSNLYVSILNQFGLVDKSFGSSTGPLPGLEIG